MARVIFHIDLNSFFASAEEVLNPALRGKPVVVSGHTRRSVVSTANYEARKYGVRSAMPVQQALKLCPGLIVVEGHYRFYEDLSDKFIQSIKTYTPLVEQASIDECYADMTDIIKNYEKPLDLAWQIQQNLFHDLHLKCSIGVAPNKSLAKVASDMRKPMGITVLRKQEVHSKLWPLAVEDLQGIGKKTAPALHKLGIKTIKDLATYEDVQRLKIVLGKNTANMIAKANGEGSDQIVMNHDIKSLSQSTTFLVDITEYQECIQVFKSLSKQLSKRMIDSGVKGDTISISVRYYDFNTIVRSKKINMLTYNDVEIYEAALSVFDENQSENAIRHLGIHIGNLKKISEITHQLSLFDEYVVNETDNLIDQLNKQLNDKHFKRASEIKK